jgi:hypothetical protein
MFSFFKRKNPDDSLKEELRRARDAYEKVTTTEGDSDQLRGARVRMALMCRAHLDKTFVDGAQQTARYQDELAQSIANGEESPEAPEPSCYQKVKAVSGYVHVYLPLEFSREAFRLGAAYQRMDIDAGQAIRSMQELGDRVFAYELNLTESFQMLQFLRDETAARAPQDNPDAEASADTGTSPGSSL